MHAALMADGLFDDEAEAMLNTWELGISRAAGQRLFFIVPRAWTDAVLPLEVSQEADIVRTMVGRIELTTPEHHRLLRLLSQTPVSSMTWADSLSGRGELSYQKLWERRLHFADLGIEAPAEYRDYLALGRFRNALVLDALGKQAEVLGSTVTGSPVRGLRPCRPCRDFTEKAPKPRNSTRSPLFMALMIWSKIVLMIRSTSR